MLLRTTLVSLLGHEDRREPCPRTPNTRSLGRGDSLEGSPALSLTAREPVCANCTIAEVFARLKKIQLIEIEGKKYLINVASKDKKLVEALGFGGLYDSPEAALKPLMRLA